jgi:ferredoxin-type protein NapH
VAKIKQLPARQRNLQALVFVSFLLLPVTLHYFSPAIILGGASEGVVNASLIVFALMFVSALFVGRLWCGWACPAGGLQDLCAPINDRLVSGSKLDWVKWAIWLPWIGGIAALAIRAGGYHTVDPFYQLESGVTLAIPPSPEAPPWYAIYYVIVALFAGLAIVFGRRAGCHTVCWMAPFMILGRKIRNLFRWPAFRLKAEPANCTDCQTCTRHCPMSLDVNRMVQRADMEDSECILCGNCVDGCPKGAIRFSFSAGA